MEKFYAIKVKLDDNTYSELIPVSALAENVIYNNDYNIKDSLGTVDIEEDGNLQEQIKNINNQKANIYTGLGTHTDGAISQNSSTGLFTNRPILVIGDSFPVDSGFGESVLLFDISSNAQNNNENSDM